MNLSLYNLNQILYNYIWNYLVDKDNFISQDAIFLEDHQRIVDKYLAGGFNYITFYCDKFKSDTLFADIAINEGVGYQINQRTSGILKISFYGNRAFERMFLCQMRHNNAARLMLGADLYLAEHGISLFAGEVINESNLLNNINKIEKASIEMKILFNAEYLINSHGASQIEKIEVTDNL